MSSSGPPPKPAKAPPVVPPASPALFNLPPSATPPAPSKSAPGTPTAAPPSSTPPTPSGGVPRPLSQGKTPAKAEGMQVRVVISNLSQTKPMTFDRQATPSVIKAEVAQQVPEFDPELYDLVIGGGMVPADKVLGSFPLPPQAMIHMNLKASTATTTTPSTLTIPAPATPSPPAAPSPNTPATTPVTMLPSGPAAPAAAQGQEIAVKISYATNSVTLKVMNTLSQDELRRKACEALNLPVKSFELKLGPVWVGGPGPLSEAGITSRKNELDVVPYEEPAPTDPQVALKMELLLGTLGAGGDCTTAACELLTAAVGVRRPEKVDPVLSGKFKQARQQCTSELAADFIVGAAGALGVRL